MDTVATATIPTNSPSDGSKKIKALLLDEKEQFIFDFSGTQTQDAEEIEEELLDNENENNNNNNRLSSAADSKNKDTTETDETFMNIINNVKPIIPIDAAAVKEGFNRALHNGSRVLLQTISLENAITEFQSGLRRYAEALNRQSRIKRNREEKPHARKQQQQQQQVTPRTNNNNNNNNNNERKKRKRG